MKLPTLAGVSLLSLSILFTANLPLNADTPGGIAPRSLMPDNMAQVTPDKPDGQVTGTLGKDGIDVQMQAGAEGYPGIVVQPANAKTWDLSPFGHIEARITNTSAKALTIGLRVDNDGSWKDSPWSTENLRLKPGETQAIPYRDRVERVGAENVPMGVEEGDLL